MAALLGGPTTGGCGNSNNQTPCSLMPRCHDVPRQPMVHVEIHAADSCTVKVIRTWTPNFSESKINPDAAMLRPGQSTGGAHSAASQRGIAN